MRSLIGTTLAVLAISGSMRAWAQEEHGAPMVHPQPIIQGQSVTPVAPPGGIDQQGVATPGQLPRTAPAMPLEPGPPAGDQRAAYLSNDALIAGGVAAVAIVVCAVVCFSNSSGTTTSTTVVHR